MSSKGKSNRSVDYTRRKRPTIQDAEAFVHGDDGFLVIPAPRTSTKELEKRCEAIGNRVHEHLRHIRRLELVILKGHVLAEHVMELFLTFRFKHHFDFDRNRLTFAQKLELVHAVGLPPDPVVLPILEILNKVRNQIAHRLDFDRELVDKMLQFTFGPDSKDRNPTNDMQRARLLKFTIYFVCFSIIGMAEGLRIAKKVSPAGG